MVFSSSVFFMAFLPITVLVYFLIPERFLKIRNLWLLFASLLFYGWGEPKYIAVMAFSIAFNYVFGRVIGRLRTQADEQEALPAGAAETEAAGRNDVAGSDENSSRQRLRRAKLAMVLCVIGNLTILGFFKYTDFLIGQRAARRTAEPFAYRAADRDLVLYFPNDVLYHRRLLGESACAAGFHRVRGLRDAVSAADCGSDRALRGRGGDAGRT